MEGKATEANVCPSFTPAQRRSALQWGFEGPGWSHLSFQKPSSSLGPCHPRACPVHLLRPLPWPWVLGVKSGISAWNSHGLIIAGWFEGPLSCHCDTSCLHSSCKPLPLTVSTARKTAPTQHLPQCTWLGSILGPEGYWG